MEQVSATGQRGSEIVMEPSDVDYLFGRGERCTQHPGNRLLRRLLDANQGLYQRRYDYASDAVKAKRALILSIMKAFQNKTGGRFLQRQRGNLVEGWVVVNNPQLVLQKLAQCMRDMIAASAAKANACTNLSRLQNFDGNEAPLTVSFQSSCQAPQQSGVHAELASRREHHLAGAASQQEGDSGASLYDNDELFPDELLDRVLGKHRGRN